MSTGKVSDRHQGGEGGYPVGPDGERAPSPEAGRSRAWRDVERLLERKRLRERLRDVFDEDPLDLPDDL